MKIRSNYVSNSSSSSFVIAYDKNTFGDLKQFLNDNYLGCESSINHKDDFEKYYLDYLDDEKKKEFENLVKEKKTNGMEIVYFYLDNDFNAVANLLKQIGKNTGKLEFLYDGSDC